MLYVMVMLVIMTTVVMAYTSLSKATRTSETRREQATIARLAIDGATLKAAYDAGLGNVTYPSTQTETIGNTVCAVTLVDNSTNLPHSLSLATTTNVGGRTYSDARVTALKMPQSQFYYCLATNSSTSIAASVTTGASSANGDIYCTGNLLLSGSDNFNGDVEATGSIAQNAAKVTGLCSANTYPIPLTAPVAANYSSISFLNLLNILLGNLLTGETFLTPYSVVYCNGNTTLSGKFTGKGIVFVNGNVTVKANMSYLLPGDEVAIIVTGNVTVTKINKKLIGYWYCGGTFSVAKGTVLTRGCIVTNSLVTPGLFTATYDPIIWNTPGEAKRMKLPGFWP
ncbi:MAG: hypothetical protein ACYC96_05435 [Fimbriimonadaceae bacterium]